VLVQRTGLMAAGLGTIRHALPVLPRATTVRVAVHIKTSPFMQRAGIGLSRAQPVDGQVGNGIQSVSMALVERALIAVLAGSIGKGMAPRTSLFAAVVAGEHDESLRWISIRCEPDEPSPSVWSGYLGSGCSDGTSSFLRATATSACGVRQVECPRVLVRNQVSTDGR
jgi:hypothetical protein